MKFIVDVTLEKLDYDEDPAEIGERFMAVLTNTDVHGVESVNSVEASSDEGERGTEQKGSGINP
ncbi:MAG: hypothetical protein M3535_01035 [Actinomycetota bacterium]|nr:hypothetical protein [Actinomycetota bacterium]